MQLDHLKAGINLLIKKINPTFPAYRQKLLALGLVPGTTVSVSYIAPLGDPIELKVRGASVVLRKKEAVCLEMEEVDA